MISSPRLRRALDYWNRRRADRLMPARADIDPMHIVDLLQFVLLIDVLSDPRDFRYRLIGTAVVEISRSDMTGRRLSATAGKGPGSIVWDNCERVVTCRAPFSRSPPYIGPSERFRDCENLLMPLSTDGDRVDMVFQVVDFKKG